MDECRRQQVASAYDLLRQKKRTRTQSQTAKALCRFTLQAWVKGSPVPFPIKNNLNKREIEFVCVFVCGFVWGFVCGFVCGFLCENTGSPLFTGVFSWGLHGLGNVLISTKIYFKNLKNENI